MGILAIDFGGTRTRAAWFAGDDLELAARQETRSRVEEGQEAVIARIIETGRAVLPEAERIKAVGICAPGPLDPATGTIRHARTLPGWKDVPLAGILEEAFEAPAYMQNDGNLGALAEYHRGAAQGRDPAVYMTISTGIGGGAVVNGALFTGGAGLAIEPGHLVFTLPGGEVHRLEDLASGTAIGETARARLAANDTPSMLREAAHVDGKAVGEAALAGDGLALAIIEAAGRWLGLGLVNVAHLLNPQVIVLGGGVAALGELLLASAREILAAWVLAPGFNPPDLLRPAQLGDDVCLVGAALHAKHLT